MDNIFSRTEMIIGAEGLIKLKQSKVAVVGIGGVGSYVVEGLVRAGLGSIILIDSDDICISNINRQIHATIDTVGTAKVDAMRDRILKINPYAKVTTHKAFYSCDNSDCLIPDDCDYIVDAIDTISSKIDLIVNAKTRNIPIISSMGAGNKLHPEKLEIADIYKTSVCPLAKVVRRELRKRNIDSLKVVYSKEIPLTPVTEHCIAKSNDIEKPYTKSYVPGSISFVPSVAGLIIAGEVTRYLINLS